MSLYIASSSFGSFIGPPIWGALADRSGYSMMFACAGVALILGTISFLLVLRRERVPDLAGLSALEEG